ncbi:MAG: UDP-N-acetylmuramoyl-L-alanyl-D-glutamate--2,6-diaminopimelate ligase [Alphaproteobacteria bacterium]|nr:UDP-N-acetylmuramoyl-L-alanyl-D-glutamate--2,6-diaminopimelate ligase [Alphaproteobacteria bacterium]
MINPPAWLNTTLQTMGGRTVRDDTRTLQPGEVLVWDSRIAPHKTAAVLADAQTRGAGLVVSDVTALGVHTVPDAGLVLAAWARQQFPQQPAQLVGVTGTSGKTSVAWFARQLAARAGVASASIGTLGVMRTDSDFDEEYTGFTSPTALKLHPILQQLAQEGRTFCAMEISSHALALRRAEGVMLTTAGYTNFSQDHLDFHGSLAEYFQAKLRLFTELLPNGGTAVINSSREELWPVLGVVKQRGNPLLSVGTRNAELVVQIDRADARGLQLQLKYDTTPVPLDLPLLGAFQAENLAVALGLCVAAGLPWPALAAAAAKVSGVPGRMELVRAGNAARVPAVVVDYAHKPDALEKALRALRPVVPAGGRLHVVFGCGGDRDATKRPIMGKIAADLADVVVVTDDNPRTEDAAAIRRQVLAGAGANAQEIGDRARAIAATLEAAGPTDVVLVAGKGHEQGQIVGREVLPFDDRVAVRQVLESLYT